MGDQTSLHRAGEKYHPDGSSHTSNSGEFIKVCEAYKKLYKRVSRENYDARMRSDFDMVPSVDMSFMNQNVHKSWKKYQAAMRNKQFGYNVSGFRGSRIVHKKPLVIKTQGMNSMLSVIPSKLLMMRPTMREGFMKLIPSRIREIVQDFLSSI